MASALNASRRSLRALARSTVVAQGKPRGFYSDTAAAGPNAMYLESLYSQWKANPGSLEAKWADYFKALEEGGSPALPASRDVLKESAITATYSRMTTTGGGQAVARSSEQGGLLNLMRAYQKRGHEAAQLCPLGIHDWRVWNGREHVAPLDPAYHGFTESDMDKPFQVQWPGLKPNSTLREIMGQLKKVYANKIGFEYLHIQDQKKTSWIQDRIEAPTFVPSDKEKVLKIYTALCKVDTFESFLTSKYKTTKRFGCDGGEAAVAGMMACVEKAVSMGVKDVVIGMPHRGRLNMLVNVVDKPLEQMFAEFKGTHYDFDELMTSMEASDWSFAGDVKYHLGTSNDIAFPGGKARVTLEANPSHLETVNGVTLGRTRAKQFYAGDTEETRKQVMPVLFHGDASFAGQGVCYETMQLAHVTDFDVGGTIHVIINNQIGFTTDPVDDRSTLYCSDLGKAFSLPILHCNGDDPAGVTAVFELAAEWRQTFQTDVIIDVICYRRYGHNETLNPDYTQPLLYQKIARHPRTEQVFADSIIEQGICTKAELDAIKESIWQRHEEAFLGADNYKGKAMEWVATKWENFKVPTQAASGYPTGIEMDMLKRIGRKLCEVPEGFNLHNGLKRQLKAKLETIETGKDIDWGTAEALAYGSLLLERTITDSPQHVRITGQDVQSGTFAHRHCVIRDQKTAETYCFLNNLGDIAPQAKFIARNSILAEYAVLGFELGYSYENPNALCIWEAQFGDFANTAQVMIDQFISAGEHKWLQQTGLVLLLPHGYEGQGAEHSSCRLERFLQLCDDDEDDIPDFAEDFGRNQAQKANWQVMNVSTPANVFHALRRQQARDFRKPLVIASTKSLFRHKSCKSDLEEFAPGTTFRRLIAERDQEIASNPDKVDRLIFCSGKLYYELVEERERLGLKNVAICTVEQIAPFPFDRVRAQMELYKNVDIGDGVHPGQILWVQEEPKNMGPWQYVKPRFVTTAREGLNHDLVMRYVGRRAAASPATGYAKVHAAEQSAIIKEALVGHDDLDWELCRPSKLLGHQT